ncbi:MAG TPA: sigma-70 family RNA polymerase sigma factor [Actinomycetota bacterium]|jgi:RNA polymerase sigma factor (sigma-70 family)|nr:sigma-70 family RNA polymerase sigma factor [Actinomycetota bacterium]
MSVPPFSRFLEEHRTLIYRYLVATVGAQDAEDCFQETFLAALRAYAGVRDEGDGLRAWILTIASRKAIDHARARARRPVPVEEVPDGAAVVSDDGVDAALWAAVRELPPMQRDAVVHRYVLDLPYADVARALGVSEEAARASAYEGRKKLRTRVREEALT